MEVKFLILSNGASPVETFLEQLDDKANAKILWLIEMLGREGKLIHPHGKKIQGFDGLWELRTRSSRKAIRIFYSYFNGEIVLIHGFIKKTEATPRREIYKAMTYLKEMGLGC